jgi:DNA-binding Lrp family transcriptional regulator
MVSAILLMTVTRGTVAQLGSDLAGIPGVTEVFSVAGRYDLAVLIRVKSPDDLAELVTGTIAKFDQITSTETLIAFKVYSRHDLEAMFSIGDD